MEMPYHSMDKSKTSGFAFELSEDDGFLDKNTPTKFPPPPDWIDNTTCYSPALMISYRSQNDTFFNQNKINVGHVTPEDVLKFSLLCVSSLFTVFLNVLFILVLCNQKNFKKRWIRPQPRYMFISIGINDLIMGLLVLVLSTYPALYKCWPFGKSICQVQVSLLFTALFHEH